jgi:hypothetical protein
MALLMGAALIGLLAACDGEWSGQVEVVPDAAQVLRLDLKGPKQGDITQLDPQQLCYLAEQQIAKEIIVGRLTLNQDNHVVGDGASRWDVSPDGVTEKGSESLRLQPGAEGPVLLDHMPA